MKTFDTKDPKMAAYWAAVLELDGKFDGIEVHQAKRNDNIAADYLARLGASHELAPSITFLEILS